MPSPSLVVVGQNEGNISLLLTQSTRPGGSHPGGSQDRKKPASSTETVLNLKLQKIPHIFDIACVK